MCHSYLGNIGTAGYQAPEVFLPSQKSIQTAPETSTTTPTTIMQPVPSNSTRVSEDKFDSDEKYTEGSYTAKIDVFSFGICLWHMATR